MRKKMSLSNKSYSYNQFPAQNFLVVVLLNGYIIVFAGFMWFTCPYSSRAMGAIFMTEVKELWRVWVKLDPTSVPGAHFTNMV